MKTNEKDEQPEKNKGGRPRGSAMQKSRVIANKLAEEEMTPLEVMVRTMKSLLAEAEAIDPDSIKNAKEKADAIKERRSLKLRACEVAKDAAPFIHARLQSVAVHGDDSQPPVRSEAVTTVLSASEYAAHIASRNLPMPDIEA